MPITEYLSKPNWNDIALGDLTNAKFQSMFNHTRNLRADNTASIVDHDGYRCLAHFYGINTFGPVCGMNEWKSLPSSGLNEVWYGYHFKWQSGFIYPISGKFYGVACGTFGEGGGFATGGDGPASEMLADDKGGSIRMGPNSNLKLNFYVYDHNMTGTYGRNMGVSPFGQMVPGQWHWIVCRFVMNNPNTLSNGVAQCWLDGQLVASTNQIRWTRPEITAQKFKILAIHSFTGGGDSRWNSVQNQYMYQRDMFIWYTDNPLGNGLFTASDSIETPMGYLGQAPTNPPSGTVTIGNITTTSTTASIIYSYNASDQTGFQYRINGGSPISSSSSPIQLTGLTSSTSYTIQVRAINSEGSGNWSNVSNFTTQSGSSGGGGSPIVVVPGKRKVKLKISE